MKTTKNACKRCSAIFASNTKLYKHVREHHTKSEKQSETTSRDASKSLFFFFFSTIANVSTASLSISLISISKLFFSAIIYVETVSHEVTTSSIVLELSLFIISCVETISTASFKSVAISAAISLATSNASLSETEIDSKLIATSIATLFSISLNTSSITLSFISFATSNISLSWAAIAAILSSTPSTTSLRTSVAKSYNHVFESQNRVKFYLTIDDLYRMFARKSRRTCLLNIRNSIYSSSFSLAFVSHLHLKSIVKSFTQTRITFYLQINL